MQIKTSQRQSAQTEQRSVQLQPGPAASRKSGALGNAGLLLSLQRSHGNRFVQRMLDDAMIQRACGCGTCADCAKGAQTEEPPGLQQKSLRAAPFIQAKLTVSHPGDAYEQEADRVADQVVHRLAAAGPGPSRRDGGPCVQREEDSTASEEEPTGNPVIEQINAILEQDGLQAKTESDGSSIPDDFESELPGTKGGGHLIPEPARVEMESAFGTDFSDVRLHTDSQAARMSQDIGAHAFTHGNDIYFNQGQFNPSTSAGKHLLAHELTHTIQQGGNQIRRLSITRHSRVSGDCGMRRVRWIFTLDNPAPADGYIVQKVKMLETIENCPSNVASISLAPTTQFWEAWEVNAGDTRHAVHSSFGFTDQSFRGEATNQSGCQATLGTVKFFLKSVTGDLGTFGHAPAGSGSSWGPGNAPQSASLPSTTSAPSWWSGTPAEGPAQRWASSWWNCCGEKSSHFSRVDSSP